jgi:hypothetical protein
MRITRGLKSSSKDVEEVALPRVAEFIAGKTNCYELIGDTNRVFFDFDGKDIHLPADDFARLDGDVRNRIIEVCERLVGDDYALMTALSHLHHVVSFRVVFTTRTCSREHNRLLATTFNGELEGLHPNIKADDGVYGKGRKMRMLGQSKDGENRPLVLLHGETADTFLTEFIDSCEAMDETPPPKAEKVKKVKVKKDKDAEKAKERILSLLEHITAECIADHENWIRMGFFLFNNGFECDVWDEISKLADNYEEGECAKRWATFNEDVERPLVNPAFLMELIEKYNPEAFAKTYPMMKIAHEVNAFKVLSPSGYCVITEGELQLLAKQGITDMFNKKTLDGERFVNKWIEDESIKTYTRLNFYPKQSLCPETEYNVFKGIAVEKVEKTDGVDLSMILTQMRDLVGGREDDYLYLLRYIAHIFQFPEDKPGVCLIFNGSQGTGKDTFWDFVGTMLGDELYFTSGAEMERDVFGNFNMLASSKLLINLSETNSAGMIRCKEKLKANITAEKITYNGKNMKPFAMRSYERYVVSSNDDAPVLIEGTDRRYALFTPLDHNRSNRSYWDTLVGQYRNKTYQRAFYDLLMATDLTGYDPRVRPITDSYAEVKTACAPFDFKWFNEFLFSGSHKLKYTAKELQEAITSSCKFPMSFARFKRSMDVFVEAGGLKRSISHGVVRYTILPEQMTAFIKLRGYWVELRGDDDVEDNE